MRLATARRGRLEPACGRKLRLAKGNWRFERVEIGFCVLLWSPDQRAGRLRRMHPDNLEGHIIHETIYASIDAHQGGAEKGNGRGPAPTEDHSWVPPDHPGRLLYGSGRAAYRESAGRHREPPVPRPLGERVHQGCYNRSAIGTSVERKTRNVVLSKIRGCTALEALEGLGQQLGKQRAIMRQSMSYGRGSEMVHYDKLARRLKLDLSFADPHAPWQCGSNENTNGLLRQFMPKGPA